MANKKWAYCPNCGEKIVSGSVSCTSCGRPCSFDGCFPGIPSIGAGGIGWAYVTGHERCFINNKSRTRKSLVIFGTILSAGLGLGIAIYSKDVKWGLTVAVIIMVINIICYITGNSTKADWEGSVIDKKHTQESSYDDENGNSTIHDVYKIVFRMNDGRNKTQKDYNSSRLFNYLQIGDMVRFHGTNMRYFEKYDKSRDSELPCAGCGLNVDARANYCPYCGCIMLKGAAGGQMFYQQGFQQQPFMQQGQAFVQPFVQPQNMGQPQQTFAQLQCPTCGSLLSPGSKFCPGCGTQLM